MLTLAMIFLIMYDPPRIWTFNSYIGRYLVIDYKQIVARIVAVTTFCGVGYLFNTLLLYKKPIDNYSASDSDLYRCFYLEGCPKILQYHEDNKNRLYKICIEKINTNMSNLSIINKHRNIIYSTTIYGLGNKIYFVKIRDNKIDIIYFFVDGSGAFLNDFKIIGEQDGKIKELYDIKNIPSDKLENVSKGCRMYIYRSIHDNQIRIILYNSTTKYKICIEWNWNKYICK